MRGDWYQFFGNWAPTSGIVDSIERASGPSRFLNFCGSIHLIEVREAMNQPAVSL
jgi:hypothetical protein